MSVISPFEAKRKNRPSPISAGWIGVAACYSLHHTAYISGRLKKLVSGKFTKPNIERSCHVSAELRNNLQKEEFLDQILSHMISELVKKMKAGKIRPCGNAESLVKKMPIMSRTQLTESGVELAVGLEPGETTKIVLAVCG